MVNGKTESGFEFEIEDEALDDWELVDALIAFDSGKSWEIHKAVEMLLGAEQSAKLKEHCRKSGRVSSKQMVTEFLDILKNAGKTGKN